MCGIFKRHSEIYYTIKLILQVVLGTTSLQKSYLLSLASIYTASVLCPHHS